MSTFKRVRKTKTKTSWRSLRSIFIIGGLSVVCVVLIVFGVSQAAPPYTFVKTDADGFGSAQNHIDVFDNEAIVFDGYLYVSMENTGAGGNIWRTSDGSVNGWSVATNDGIGDATNYAITTLVEFDNYIYAGTQNANGTELWKWTGDTADAWDKVISDEVDGNGVGTDENGLGLGVNIDGDEKAQEMGSSVRFKYNGAYRLLIGVSPIGQIYYSDDGSAFSAATDENLGFGTTKEVWIHELVDAGDYIFAAVGSEVVGANNGGQVWRCLKTSGCDVQGDWSRVTDAGLDPPGGGTIDHVYEIEEFGDYVYIGTEEEAGGGTGGQIWQCFTDSCIGQSKWSVVVSNGFGDANNDTIFELRQFADYLYVGTENSIDGSELWRSFDGSTFTLAAGSGPMDANNRDMRSIIGFQNYLHIFSHNSGGLHPMRQDLAPELGAALVDSAQKDGTGQVQMDFSMDDIDDTTRGEVQVEYSTDAGLNYSQATMSTEDDDTTATTGDPDVRNTGNDYQIGSFWGYVDASSGSNSISAMWNSDTDESNTNVLTTRLRVTSYDGYGEGETLETGNFEIDNEDPTIEDITVDPSAAKAGDVITITFSVDEGLDEDPEVKIDGVAGEIDLGDPENVDGFNYEYKYTVSGVGTDTEGSTDFSSLVYDDFRNSDTDTKGVTLDFTPPTTSSDPDGGTYNESQDVILQSNDDAVGGAVIMGTGVDNTYYTTDGSDPTLASPQYAGPIETGGDDGDVTIIKYFSDDNVDNEEEIRTASYVTDTDAPEGSASFVIGSVFNDMNRNTAHNIGESGMENVTVRLYVDEDDSGTLDLGTDSVYGTTSSDVNGNFTFLGLPQDRYMLNIDETTVPGGWTITTNNNPGALALLNPGQGFTAAFGYADPVAREPDRETDDDDDDDDSDAGDDDSDRRTPSDSDDDETPDESGGGEDGSRPGDDDGSPGRDTTPGDSDKTLRERVTDGVKEFLGLDDIDVDEDASAVEKTAEIAKQIASKLGEDIRRTFYGPLSAIALAATAVGFGLTSSGFLTYLRYLLQLITEPFRLLAGHKNKRWGVVYDSGTRRPVDLAIVRLYDAETSALLQTSVTDKAGRYLFLVSEEGKYRMTVTKPGFEFPPDPAVDPKNGIYVGGVIEGSQLGQKKNPTIDLRNAEATSQEDDGRTLIRLDIPISREEGSLYIAGNRKPVQVSIGNLAAFQKATPEERKDDDKKIQFSTLGRKVSHVIAYIGPLTGLVSLIMEPSLLTVALFVLHIILFLLFRRLAIMTAGEPWGNVSDLGSNKSLSSAVVRLFDEKYGKLLLAKVTSGDGRYAFLVGDGKYTLTANKENYLFPEGSVPVHGGEDIEINEDLGMRRVAEE